MRAGLDWGTTNSSAAVYDGRQVRLIELDPHNAAPQVLRSALFIARDGQVALGRAAIDRYTAGNVGREIAYQRVYVGENEVTFAEVGTIKQSFYTDVDANAPGRLFVSIKLALADSSYAGTDVFGARWTIEELVALMLERIARRVREATGAAVSAIVIGRPVHYAGESRADDLALARMRRAAALAGLTNVQFLAEPTAASLTFRRRSAKPQHLLVFDFGGGTLDVTIARVDPDGSREVLATSAPRRSTGRGHRRLGLRAATRWYWCG
jgi:hypothetical chaperone protein